MAAKSGALLNYTTSIDPERTVGEITGLLVRGGAQRVSLDYREGQVSAISFVMPNAFGDRPFRVPARIEAIQATLARQHRAGKVERRHTTREQAARVGWRIVKDWLEAQLALVESGMASLDEVMLPYLLPDRSGKTMYELTRDSQLALEASGRHT